MDAKVLFSAGIRLIGLWYAARGFNDLLYFFLVYTGAKPVSVGAELPYAELSYGVFFFLSGLYLLRGAPLVVEYAFPSKSSAIEVETEQPIQDEEDTSN